MYSRVISIVIVTSLVLCAQGRGATFADPLQENQRRLAAKAQELQRVRDELQQLRSAIIAERDSLGQAYRSLSERKQAARSRNIPQINYANYHLCPARLPYHECSHHDLKRRWLDQQNALIDEVRRQISNESGRIQAQEQLLAERKSNLNQKRVHYERLLAQLKLENDALSLEVRKLVAQVRRAAPEFRAISKKYQDARIFADRIAHKANRCAMALSMTLDLRPETGELSIADIAHHLVHPDYRGKEILRDFYAQAQQLADRLRREKDWGNPKTFGNLQEARKYVTDRTGIIFFQDADWRWGTLSDTGDHIDIWDGKKTGSDYEFRSANSVWFWEILK